MGVTASKRRARRAKREARRAARAASPEARGGAAAHGKAAASENDALATVVAANEPTASDAECTACLRSLARMPHARLACTHALCDRCSATCIDELGDDVLSLVCPTCLRTAALPDSSFARAVRREAGDAQSVPRDDHFAHRNNENSHTNANNNNNNNNSSSNRHHHRCHSADLRATHHDGPVRSNPNGVLAITPKQDSV
eukprot:TRINITY_DN345_c0_g1_i1.p2 TRINITY_DN345_c0_g1~~TRINITY_DN345_c0_g1_i1.p2  ORF type:complete len:200 (-),score=92.50 TRINITY_DN345_c0_g1_i1:174-773(-)